MQAKYAWPYRVALNRIGAGRSLRVYRVRGIYYIIIPLYYCLFTGEPTITMLLLTKGQEKYNTVGETKKEIQKRGEGGGRGEVKKKKRKQEKL